MTTASNKTYSDPYLTNLRDSRKKSIGVEFMINPDSVYTMRRIAALKGFTEAQTQPRISELLTDGVIKVVGQRTDQIMKSKVSVYQFVPVEDREEVEPKEQLGDDDFIGVIDDTLNDWYGVTYDADSRWMIAREIFNKLKQLGFKQH